MKQICIPSWLLKDTFKVTRKQVTDQDKRLANPSACIQYTKNVLQLNKKAYIKILNG